MAESRVKPACDHYNMCGGCNRQTTDYKTQLHNKKEKIIELFREAGINISEFLGIEPSPEIFAYRNKMEFSFGDLKKGGRLQLGLHPRGRQYDVVTVDTCRLVDRDFRKILSAVIEYFRGTGLKKYHIKLREGYLRNLVVRKGLNTGEILVNLVTTSQNHHDYTALIRRLKNLNYRGKLVGFLQTINDNYADAINCDKVLVHYGRDYFYERLFDMQFRIKPFSFFQVNTRAGEKLYSTVKNFLGRRKNKIIYDLYCGTGTISLIIAARAEAVIGIEVDREAVTMARENSELNDMENCQFYTGEVVDKLEKINQKPDVIIIDPPRPGIHPAALEKIINLNCREIIYVSCNPRTLVRDLKKFKGDGYRVEKVKCVDMFPHTDHIETCTRLLK